MLTFESADMTLRVELQSDQVELFLQEIGEPQTGPARHNPGRCGSESPPPHRANGR
jgi:hypothetical protein